MQQNPSVGNYKLEEVLIASHSSDQSRPSALTTQQRSLERFYSVEDGADASAGPAISVSRAALAENEKAAANPTAGLISTILQSQTGSASPLLAGSGKPKPETLKPNAAGRQAPLDL